MTTQPVQVPTDAGPVMITTDVERITATVHVCVSGPALVLSPFSEREQLRVESVTLTYAYTGPSWPLQRADVRGKLVPGDPGVTVEMTELFRSLERPAWVSELVESRRPRRGEPGRVDVAVAPPAFELHLVEANTGERAPREYGAVRSTHVPIPGTLLQVRSAGVQEWSHYRVMGPPGLVVVDDHDGDAEGPVTAVYLTVTQVQAGDVR